MRKHLEEVKSDDVLESIVWFEKNLTLDELLAFLLESDSDAQLISLLSQRWERIRGSNLCYTRQPYDLVNQLCLDLAKAISPPVTTEAEIEALAPRSGPYCLLMPTLETTEDVYRGNIHELGLHEFVLSDNERVHIPLAKCLKQAAESYTGALRHVVMIDGECLPLTPDEIECVSHHSQQAAEVYQSLLALNKQRLYGDEIGAKLAQLVAALRGGGARASGEELNAGAVANQGIYAFYDYWQTVPEERKTAIFMNTPELKDLLGRLFRPDDVNYREVRFCVELIAERLDPIIAIYNQQPTLQMLHSIFSEKESAFQSAAQSPYGLTIIPCMKAPNILERIFQLNDRERTESFSDKCYENVVRYALMYKPESLSGYEFDSALKRRLVTAQDNPNEDSLLILAAKEGKTDSIRQILNWGGNIEARDIRQSRALHWAANNGHVDAVKCLLEYGALLESKGHDNCTALLFAVMHGKAAVVELLLQKNVNVNAIATRSSLNALSIAIIWAPELVELILMHVATLPLAEQRQCFWDLHDGSSYPNALFYAAEEKPALFDVLLDKILEHPPESCRAILQQSDLRGVTALHSAATIGADKSIRKLLEFGLNIELCDMFFRTALHHAVMNQKQAAVDELLKQNAKVNARDCYRNNVLDLAIKSENQVLIRSILMQVLTLSHKEQAECLLIVPGGPFADVFTYVVLEKPTHFDHLFLTNKASFNDINTMLTGMHFDEHLLSIHAQYKRMKDLSLFDSSYVAATDAAQALLIKCMKAKLTLFQSGTASDEQISAFKKTCESAIEEARPVLSQYREWGKVLAVFLLAIITFPVALILCATGFFSVKTKSEQLLDQLQIGIHLGCE